MIDLQGELLGEFLLEGRDLVQAGRDALNALAAPVFTPSGNRKLSPIPISRHG